MKAHWYIELFQSSFIAQYYTNMKQNLCEQHSCIITYHITVVLCVGSGVCSAVCCLRCFKSSICATKIVHEDNSNHFCSLGSDTGLHSIEFCLVLSPSPSCYGVSKISP